LTKQAKLSTAFLFLSQVFCDFKYVSKTKLDDSVNVDFKDILSLIVINNNKVRSAKNEKVVFKKIFLENFLKKIFLLIKSFLGFLLIILLIFLRCFIFCLL